jgi:hypothetical protein
MTLLSTIQGMQSIFSLTVIGSSLPAIFVREDRFLVTASPLQLLAKIPDRFAFRS